MLTWAEGCLGLLQEGVLAHEGAAWQGEARGWENGRQTRPAAAESVRDPCRRWARRTLLKEARKKRSYSRQAVAALMPHAVRLERDRRAPVQQVDDLKIAP